jgi:hypothetical protein
VEEIQGRLFFFCFFAGGDGGASFARQKKSGFPRGTEDRLCGILVGIFIFIFLSIALWCGDFWNQNAWGLGI